MTGVRTLLALTALSAALYTVQAFTFLPDPCVKLVCFAAFPSMDCKACFPCSQDTRKFCKNIGYTFDGEKCSCIPPEVFAVECDPSFYDLKCPPHQVKNSEACSCHCSWNTRQACTFMNYSFDEKTCQCSGGGLTCAPFKVPNLQRGVCECTQSGKEACEKRRFVEEEVKLFQDEETCECKFVTPPPGYPVDKLRNFPL